ncbi:hypothetical protein MNV49_001834 [Pseudohyphozyma bogoriensis]|nr:hypothetical protein MNV49_001834 [Pseudohyphozyma bogoriensis]
MDFQSDSTISNDDFQSILHRQSRQSQHLRPFYSSRTLFYYGLQGAQEVLTGKEDAIISISLSTQTVESAEYDGHSDTEESLDEARTEQQSAATVELWTSSALAATSGHAELRP